MPANTSSPLIRLTAAECRWNGPIPPGVRAWAIPATGYTDRPYGDLAQRLRTAMAAQASYASGAEVQRSRTSRSPPPPSQLLQWRTQAVAKLAASRSAP